MTAAWAGKSSVILKYYYEKYVNIDTGVKEEVKLRVIRNLQMIVSDGQNMWL